jgi:hypothetical protein
MPPSHDGLCRVVRRAESRRPIGPRLRTLMIALPLALASWGCNRAESVEHEPDATDFADGEAAAPITYAFDPNEVRTVQGTVLAVQPFQRMQGSRYGVRLRIDVDGERAHVYLAPQGVLESLGLLFATGDEIEVTGSVLGEEGRRVIIATEITRGRKTYVLRDAEGRAAWKR